MRKKCILLFVVCFGICAASSLQAQSWTRINNGNPTSRPSQVEIWQDSVIWLLTSTRNYSCGDSYLQLYDMQGNSIHEARLTPNTPMIRVKGDHVYLAAYGVPFNDYSVYRTFHWNKYQANGELEYEHVIWDSYAYPEGMIPDGERYRRLSDFDVSPHENFFLCAADTVFRLDSAGRLLNRWLVDSASFLSRVHVLAEDRFLVADSSQVFALDTSGTVLASQSLGLNWLDLDFEGEHFYVLGADSLYKWTVALELEYAMALPDALGAPIALKLSNERVYLESFDSLSGVGYLTSLDRELTILESITADITQPERPFAVGQTGYMLTEIQPSLELAARTHAHWIPFGENRADSLREVDIALLDAKLEVRRSDTLSTVPDRPPFVSAIWFDLHVEIENQGSVPIEHVRAYMDLEASGFNCISPRLFWGHNSLGLAPGQRKTFVIENLYDVGTRKSPFRTYCIELLAPDLKLEANLSQNLLCKEFELPYIVSNEQELAIALNLYPNPAQDFLRIESPASALAPLQLRLLDMQGRTHQTQTLRQAAVTLDIVELPAGIYVLELMGENTQTWRKWIKE